MSARFRVKHGMTLSFINTKSIQMTVADTKNWTIFISSIANDEVEDKVDTTLLEIPINQTLNLKTYGTSVKKILGMIITYESHLPTYLEYDNTTREIHVGLKLPYTITNKSTAADTLKVMQHTFLIGILQMKTLEGIEDFDFDGLYEDVKSVFFPKTTTSVK